MGMDKFYRTVRRQFGINKEQMKREVKTEVINELRAEMEEEVSYIEAQMKEYEQLVAEVNHLLATMRKQRIQSGKKDSQIKMDEFQDDLQPLKSKLRELESSMEQRLERQRAITQ